MNVSKLQLIYLATLSMLGFIATDMYLPAFQDMQAYFVSGPQSIALSLTVFLVGMAVGQLLWGVASDKYGQKSTLFIGLLIFACASIGICFADHIWQLLAARFVQAIGVCAPAVIWQAMVIKRYPGLLSQQIFASIMPLVALSPALAPQLGVFLLHHLGWQSIFAALGIIGFLLALVTLTQPQVYQEKKQTSVISDIKYLFTSRVYLGNVAIFSAASAAFFAYLTGMPEIMAQMGYQARDIGMSFVPQTIAFMIGGYLGKVLVRKFGDAKMLRALLLGFSVASVILFIATQMTLTNIWPVLAPFCLIAICNGALYPIVVNRALSNAKQSPATAAGLQNSLQICISSLASALVALFATQALPVTGIAIIICTVGVWLGYLLTRNHTQPLSEKHTA